MNFPYLHVPVHVITVGDARCDWLKCNPLKLIEVQEEHRMRALCPRGFSQGVAARTGGQTKRREVFLSTPREKKSLCYPGYKRLFLIFLFSWFFSAWDSCDRAAKKIRGKPLGPVYSNIFVDHKCQSLKKMNTFWSRLQNYFNDFFSLAIIDRSVSSKKLWSCSSA